MIELFKDGTHMAIRSNCPDEPTFLEEFSSAVVQLVQDKTFENDLKFQLERWIPQAVDLCCAYRGYKSSVERTVVYTVGDRLLSNKDRIIVVAASEEITTGNFQEVIERLQQLKFPSDDWEKQAASMFKSWVSEEYEKTGGTELLEITNRFLGWMEGKLPSCPRCVDYADPTIAINLFLFTASWLMQMGICSSILGDVEDPLNEILNKYTRAKAITKLGASIWPIARKVT